MIDYKLVVVTEQGIEYDISDFVEDTGWEENEKELATSISFSLAVDRNDKLDDIVKLGCLVVVYADGVEVARGWIAKAKEKFAGSGDKMTVNAYDELYPLQKSEDHFYFVAGLSTKAVITQILMEWGVLITTYTGADVIHEKLVYRSGSIADTILDILKDAEKKGGKKTILQAAKGTINVVAVGSNPACYVFDEDCTVSAEQELSITDLVTRVKIIGKTKEEGRPPVEAVLDGMTQFGIRQKIYVREKDTNIAEANVAAQKILDEKGQVKKTFTVVSPDVPSIRKGDAVVVKIGGATGYFWVAGIRHDATAETMTMDLKDLPEANAAAAAASAAVTATTAATTT